MQSKTQKHNWWIDAVLFGVFILTFFLDLTGLELHQWLGMAAGGLALIHLMRHWTWVSAVGRRLFARGANRAGWYFLIDGALLLGFAAILFSGLLMSSWLNLTLAAAAFWRGLHVIASLLTLGLLVVKIGLHGRWIVRTAREKVFAESPTFPAAENARSRREFLKLMGVVGAVSLIALSSAAGSLAQSESETGSVSSAAVQTTSTGSSAGSTASSLAQSCLVRCGRRCSYPGHCRRYTDTNGNGKCDLGECL